MSMLSFFVLLLLLQREEQTNKDTTTSSSSSSPPPSSLSTRPLFIVRRRFITLATPEEQVRRLTMMGHPLSVVSIILLWFSHSAIGIAAQPQTVTDSFSVRLDSVSKRMSSSQTIIVEQALRSVLESTLQLSQQQQSITVMVSSQNLQRRYLQKQTDYRKDNTTVANHDETEWSSLKTEQQQQQRRQRRLDNELFVLEVHTVVSAGFSSFTTAEALNLSFECRQAIDTNRNDVVSTIKTTSSGADRAYFTAVTRIQTVDESTDPTGSPTTAPSRAPTTATSVPSTMPSLSTEAPTMSTPTSKASRAPVRTTGRHFVWTTIVSMALVLLLTAMVMLVENSI